MSSIRGHRRGAVLDESDFLSLSEVAKLLHCSKAHVCNAVAGRVQDCPPIPAIQIGRRKLVRRTSLAFWIERNEHTSIHQKDKTNARIRTLPERDAAERA